MPQPTRPASASSVQYWPWCQRLLMPIAVPLRNGIGRDVVRGRGSLMTGLREWGAAFRLTYHDRARRSNAESDLAARRPLGRIITPAECPDRRGAIREAPHDPPNNRRENWIR